MKLHKTINSFLYSIFSAPVHRQKHSCVILFPKVVSVKSLPPFMGRRCVLLPVIGSFDLSPCSWGRSALVKSCYLGKLQWVMWRRRTLQLFCWKLFVFLSHKLSLFLVGTSVGFDLFCFGSSLSQTKQWICPQHKKCWIMCTLLQSLWWIWKYSVSSQLNTLFPSLYLFFFFFSTSQWYNLVKCCYFGRKHLQFLNQNQNIAISEKYFSLF